MTKLQTANRRLKFEVCDLQFPGDHVYTFRLTHSLAAVRNLSQFQRKGSVTTESGHRKLRYTRLTSTKKIAFNNKNNTQFILTLVLIASSLEQWKKKLNKVAFKTE